MSYSLIKVTSYYKNFISSYYNKNTDIIDKSYNEQYKHLMYQSNAWADFYSKGLERLGVKASEIVHNAYYLQNRWAKENGVSEKGVKLIFEQLKKMQPTVVWFQDSLTFNGQLIKELKNYVKSIKLVIGNSCAPYSKEHLKNFKEFDFITTCSPGFKTVFENNGLKTLLLYQAFDAEIIKRIDLKPENKKPEINFIGNILSGLDGHNERQTFLEKILEYEINLNYYGIISNVEYIDILKKQIVYIFSQAVLKTKLTPYFKNSDLFRKGQFFLSLPKKNKISEKLKLAQQAPVFGLEMFQVVANSAIGLNIHGDKAGDYAANMRLFETAGVATCLLTDHKKNIRDLFELDSEIVTFKSVEECLEKAKWLLDNPQKMNSIAKAGQERVLKQHNYNLRAEELNNFILKQF